MKCLKKGKKETEPCSVVPSIGGKKLKAAVHEQVSIPPRDTGQ